MLAVEYGPDNVVEINLDGQGLTELVEVLHGLTPGDHEHLLTASWGGYPLTEEFPNGDLRSRSQVTIQWFGPGETAEVDRTLSMRG